MMHEICPQRPESRPPYYPFLSKILGAKGGATLWHCDIVNHWYGVNNIAIKHIPFCFFNFKVASHIHRSLAPCSCCILLARGHWKHSHSLQHHMNRTHVLLRRRHAHTPRWRITYWAASWKAGKSLACLLAFSCKFITALVVFMDNALKLRLPFICRCCLDPILIFNKYSV